MALQAEVPMKKKAGDQRLPEICGFRWLWDLRAQGLWVLTPGDSRFYRSFSAAVPQETNVIKPSPRAQVPNFFDSSASAGKARNEQKYQSTLPNLIINPKL